jgi:hypothetical protein
MRVSFSAVSFSAVSSSAVRRVGVVLAQAAAVTLFAAGGAPMARGAVIGASFNEALPSTVTSYSVFGGGGGGGGGGGVPDVSIVEDVALDFAAGQWLKDLVNATANGFPSGQNRTISEVLTNAGAFTWTGWNEHVVSRTNGGGGGGGGGGTGGPPGFLFRNGSLSLSADYGAGTVPLTQGVDYTVTPVSGPPGSGNGDDWEAVTITFAPNRVIEPGDVLSIGKDIFEVFGDANIWEPGEAARVGEYPIGVPEPSGIATIAIAGMAGAATRRRRLRRQ